MDQEGRLPPSDAGAVDAGGGRDGGPPMDAASGDGGLSLGDNRAGYVQCDRDSCTGEQLCCASSARATCATECGGTESLIGCDGPEDCDAGGVCCHRFGANGLVTECIYPEAEVPDGGTPPSCEWADGGPEHRVACHVALDCQDTPDKPLCLADVRRPYLGYCSADNDDPATQGHDGAGIVGCGDPDQDGVGTLCSLNDHVCCLSRDDGNSAACTTRARCGFSELSIACDGPEDCSGGEVCCFLPAGVDADGGTVEAQSACAEDCASLGAGAVVRCHHASDCGDAGTCQVDPTSPWWGVCATE